MAKQKLVQTRKAMREELKAIVSDWPMIEQAAGVKAGVVKGFVVNDKISDADLAKLDALNRQ
jgi:hypothetical protein